MSTRSVIAIENADGTYDGVYCHFDGYPEGVGKTLVENYSDKEKVKALIELGSLSVLGKNLTAPDGVKHDFENPCKDVVIAYHRDRGDELEICHNLCYISLRKDAKKMWAEYIYIFRNGLWYYGNPETKNLSRLPEQKNF